jgi:hypothetical protein
MSKVRKRFCELKIKIKTAPLITRVKYIAVSRNSGIQGDGANLKDTTNPPTRAETKTN